MGADGMPLDLSTTATTQTLADSPEAMVNKKIIYSIINSDFGLKKTPAPQQLQIAPTTHIPFEWKFHGNSGKNTSFPISRYGKKFFLGKPVQKLTT